MTPFAESEALHLRARAFVRAFERGQPMPESFDALATDLARFQAHRVAGYGRLCAARGVDLATLTRAADAPAVPTDAFRLCPVFAFEGESAGATFRTSGTTVGARGTHLLRDVATYDLGALAFGQAMLASGLTLPVPVLVVGPSDAEAPDSSLAHMTSAFVRAWAPPDAAAARTHFMRDGRLEIGALHSSIEGLLPRAPAVVLATSFALVHLLDALAGTTLPLPPGSRVMQTGGFKGKSRDVDAATLRHTIAEMFAVEERAVIGEYGMTELSSQFWEATTARPGALPGVYVEPPWARVVPVDPETLCPVAVGDVGIARIEDLANVDSAFAVLAHDRVRRVDGGFELLGRASGAPPRGCSVAIDEMLAGAT